MSMCFGAKLLPCFAHCELFDELLVSIRFALSSPIPLHAGCTVKCCLFASPLLHSCARGVWLINWFAVRRNYHPCNEDEVRLGEMLLVSLHWKSMEVSSSHEQRSKAIAVMLLVPS
jgi:hypothetical protein